MRQNAYSKGWLGGACGALPLLAKNKGKYMFVKLLTAQCLIGSRPSTVAPMIAVESLSVGN